jgi:hypothetical protein
MGCLCNLLILTLTILEDNAYLMKASVCISEAMLHHRMRLFLEMLPGYSPIIH